MTRTRKGSLYLYIRASSTTLAPPRLTLLHLAYPFSSGRWMSPPEMCWRNPQGSIPGNPANVQYNIPVSSASLPAIKSLGLRGISCISLTNLDGSPTSQQVLQSVACHLGPHLQSLCLGGGSPTEASFVALILGCPALRILDLSGCNSLFTSGMLLAQPETAQNVRQALSGLCELNLAGLRDLGDFSFNQLGSCAPNLERLSLAYCHLTFQLGAAQGPISTQDSYFSKLSFCNVLRFIKERASRLRALDLSGTGLPPEALQALGQVAGLQLQELSLHSCRDLSTEAVATLCRQQPRLTSLDLSGCSELTDGALLAVSRGLQHLQCLNLGKLQRLTDAGCTALGRLRELRSLDMAECCLVSGQGLAQALGSVHGAPSPLTTLRLAYCSSLKLHPELEQQASEPFLEPQGPSLLMLQALQELDLTACSKLTDASLAKVLQFPQLRQLSLSLLPALTDIGLEAVARGCPSLEHLSLSHCSRLSDEGWAQAAGSWPRLQHLNLSSCSQLTEQTLDIIRQVCKQLRVLDVAMCPGINVVAIRRFQAQLPQAPGNASYVLLLQVPPVFHLLP
ncbi:PREDICTED: leucine-rich repeat-containing protein 29 isoform X7 [Chinchilla lanigera]|uniref:leucine-rich repeat-containing protein 29 isoform X7 n=1 Tax=Chinchilla lanigera TaxID=34839 RepID=UPI000695B6D6|nr:PREDICTED: leucine-rich repeat-containing protein 29 isoform X7 [Chinchilla lanigera]